MSPSLTWKGAFSPRLELPALADGDDLALLGLLLGAVRQQDPAGRLLLGLQPLDQHLVSEGPDLCHSICLLLHLRERSRGTRIWKYGASGADSLANIVPQRPDGRPCPRYRRATPTASILQKRRFHNCNGATAWAACQSDKRPARPLPLWHPRNSPSGKVPGHSLFFFQAEPQARSSRRDLYVGRLSCGVRQPCCRRIVGPSHARTNAPAEHGLRTAQCLHRLCAVLWTLTPLKAVERSRHGEESLERLS